LKYYISIVLGSTHAATKTNKQELTNPQPQCNFEDEIQCALKYSTLFSMLTRTTKIRLNSACISKNNSYNYTILKPVPYSLRKTSLGRPRNIRGSEAQPEAYGFCKRKFGFKNFSSFGLVSLNFGPSLGNIYKEGKIYVGTVSVRSSVGI
jgi:hypothetical protein